MLTREENEWNFKAIKKFSALNILPLEIDMKTGKIGRQSSKIRILLWRMLFCLGVSHCFYGNGRLLQSTVIDPEKYFRWDHFILHLLFSTSTGLLLYTGFCLFGFGENLGETVMIFNQLFEERENPVQKMVEEEKQQQNLRRNLAWGKTKRGVKTQAWVKLGPKAGANTTGISPLSPKNQNQKRELESKSKSGFTRPLLTWPPQYSLDELLDKTFSLLIEASAFFCVAILALDPSRPQLLYSVLPPEFKNLYTFFGLFLVEAAVILVGGCFAAFSNVCQLLFFDKCQAEFKRQNLQLRNLEKKFQSRPFKNRDLQREIWILKEILKEMKELVLFTELFNRCFPPCIFAWKLVCLFAIPLYFFTIRHGQDFPFLGIFTAYGAFAVTLFYGIMYQKAFSIPEKMERLKNEFLISAHKTTTTTSKSKSTPENSNVVERFWAEMNLEMGGIRDVGVKVGSFHTLERGSTPIFVDFVFRNVVNLLVTFPR